jgi:hypothetical protein
MELALGIASGIIFLAAIWRVSREALTQAGFLALLMMLSIYVGAHLVSSDIPRIVIESAFALVGLAIAFYVRDRWPVIIGFLILGHGAYDFTMGHSSGVAHWYPVLCAGFDVTFGAGLIYKFLRAPPISDERS